MYIIHKKLKTNLKTTTHSRLMYYIDVHHSGRDSGL